MKRMAAKPKFEKDYNGKWVVALSPNFVVPENKMVKVQTRDGSSYMAQLTKRADHFEQRYSDSEGYYSLNYDGKHRWFCKCDWQKVPSDDTCKGCNELILTVNAPNTVTVTATVPVHEIAKNTGDPFPVTRDVQTHVYCATCARIYGDALAALGFEPRWLKEWKHK